MKQTLVIKLDSDGFERYYNRRLSQCCRVMAYSDFYRGNTNPIVRRLDILKSVLKYRKEGLFEAYERVIVFDQLELAMTIALLTPVKKRCVLWLWNTLTPKRAKRIGLVRRLCRVFTFDDTDAQAYCLGLNSQVFEAEPGEACSPEFDLFFIGRDKGRRAQVERARERLLQAGMKPELIVVGDAANEGDAEYLDYGDVLNMIRRSRAVLDLCKENQTGITVRTLEAIAFQKKLVTNNLCVKAMKLYDESNILVLEDEADYDRIAAFIHTPMKPYSQQQIDYYGVRQWLDRFDG